MKWYITTGTYGFLKQIKETHDHKSLILMQNENNCLLLHETKGESIFKEPHKYEVIDSVGELVADRGFAVLNNIPVTEEGRPLFEYRFKNRANQIEKEPGFVAIRVLRPLSSDTYIIFTQWKNADAFNHWKASNSFEIAYTKKAAKDENGKQLPQIFPRPSYVTKYSIEKE
jgi:heme oxygenase (mycobilin-producing)